MPDLLHGDGLVLCGESEEDLRAMVERFAEACIRRGPKGKNKVARNEEED